jgi:hypothetical protein
MLYVKYAAQGVRLQGNVTRTWITTEGYNKAQVTHIQMTYPVDDFHYAKDFLFSPPLEMPSILGCNCYKYLFVFPLHLFVCYWNECPGFYIALRIGLLPSYVTGNFINLLLHGAKQVDDDAHMFSYEEQQQQQHLQHGSYDEFCQLNHHTQNNRPSYSTMDTNIAPTV